MPLRTRKLVFLLAAASGLAALAGCTVGPSFHQPKVDVEQSFGRAGNAAATSQPTTLSAAGLPSARWWQQLNDPELDHLIERAASANLDVRIATSRVRQARAELAYASGGQYPDVNVGGSYTHNRLSETAAPYNAFNVPGFPFEYNQYQAGFDASWELDVFGGVRRAVEAANADVAASAASRQDVLLSVMAEVARTYVDLRGYQRRYAIAQENLKSQRETLEVTQDRRKQGVVAELDVAQAASQVAKTEAQLPVLQRMQMQALHRISVLLGEQPEALLTELSTPAAIPVPPALVAIGVPAELLRRRPDIRRAEFELASATAHVGQATAALYPRFSLSGNFAMTTEHPQDMLDFGSRSFAFGPSVSWPIFDTGRLRRVVDVRNAEQQQALATYEKTVLSALEETHNALVAFTTEQERHAALMRAVAADQTAADVATAQYRQGVVDFLNVLEAQRSLFESQDQLADSDRAVTTSLITLYKALAGGWDLSAPAPSQQPQTEQGSTPTPLVQAVPTATTTIH